MIRDTYPTYSAVAVDPIRNEMVLQDENLFRILVYDRMANTPPGADLTEPKRVIGGNKTRVEFNCALYLDPKTGDIYSVNNDTLDATAVFSREAHGNVPPNRVLHTPHGTYGIAVDENKEELFLTVEHTNAVVIYRKRAQGDDQPLRTLQGERTGLEDPHGIALDTKEQLLYVANHGNALDSQRETGGRFEPPSITVYPLSASGNTAPLRTIQGPQTQMNWPAALSMDEERRELFVANDAGDSILVFRSGDSGDVAPARVIRGPKTGIKNPTGVVVDGKNQEVIVSNMGNHTATVYRQTANGDVPPLRTIRGAPQGKIALAIGNPGAAGYDSKREEILVPN
jgi:DNA-binding beta-propeller fold protein YncE